MARLFIHTWTHRLPHGSFRANDAKCQNFNVEIIDIDEEMVLTIDDVTRATSVNVASEAYITTDGRCTRAKLVAVQPISDILWLNLNHKDILLLNLKQKRYFRIQLEDDPLCGFLRTQYLEIHKMAVHRMHSPTADL